MFELKTPQTPIFPEINYVLNIRIRFFEIRFNSMDNYKGRLKQKREAKTTKMLCEGREREREK